MTNSDTNETARIAAVDFVRGLIPSWQAALGTDLLGAYLIGSLAHGGFSRRYSDVDVVLVTEAGMSPDALDRLGREATAQSRYWASKMSVFWADRHFQVGRLPVLDRIDYLDHAVVLVERESVRPTQPTLEEVRQYLRGAPFSDWAESARRFAVSPSLDLKDQKAYLKALLYPGRLYYSWISGRIGSNDDAVAFLTESPPAGLDLSSIVQALKCRQDAVDPDYLFPARTLLMPQVEVCAALVSA